MDELADDVLGATGEPKPHPAPSLTAAKELGRGWPILLCVFLVAAVSPPTIAGLVTGVMLPVLQGEFGWGRGAIASSISIVAIFVAIMAPPTGALADRIGTRILLPASLVLSGMCLWAVGWVHDLPIFIALHVALAITGAGCSTLITSRILASSFVRARGTALGIGLAGLGLGLMLLPVGVSWMIEAIGWRGVYAVIGAMAAAVGAIVAVPVWRHERRLDQPARLTRAAGSASVHPVLRSRVFWMLALVFLLAQTATAGLPLHFVSMMVDGGVTRSDAAAMAGLIGVSMIASRLLIGVALDIAPARLVASVVALISAVGVSAMAVGGVAMAPVGALAVGLLLGAESDLAAYMVSRYFPPNAFGRAYGLLFPVLAIGALVSSAGYGLWYDVALSYTPALIVAGATLVGCAAIFLILPRLPSVKELASEPGQA